MMSAILLVPVGLGVGLGIDYGRLSNAKVEMQAALDAAAWYGATLPATTTQSSRIQKMQQVYNVNGGVGTIAEESYEPSTRTVKLKVVANAEIPMTFMKLAHIDSVPTQVDAKVQVPLKLEKATFKVTFVKGTYGKTMTLKGRPEGGQWTDRMRIVYTGNTNTGAAKMYKIVNGVSTLTTDGVIDVADTDELYMEMKIDSDASVVKEVMMNSNKTAILATPIVQTVIKDVYKLVTSLSAVLNLSTANWNTFKSKSTVSAPNVIASKDPALVSRMYYSTLVTRGTPNNTKANAVVKNTTENDSNNLYERIGCGQVEEHAWEDGGSILLTTTDGKLFKAKERSYAAGETPNATPSNRRALADFVYEVEGKCVVRPDETARLLP